MSASKSNGHVKTNGASNGVASSLRLLVAKDALEKATANGHVVPTLGENKGVYVGKCVNCLCHVIIHDEKSDDSVVADGVLLTTKCDGADKLAEFSREPMSPEFKKRITGPWKHPGSK